MYKIIIALLLITFSIRSQNFQDLKQNTNDYNTIQKVFQNEYIGDANLDTLKGWKQFKRWEWFLSQRLAGQDKLPDAMNIKKLAEYYKVLQKSKNSSVQSVNWEKYGPFKSPQGSGRSQGIGRINDIAIDPHNSSILIAGTASGGAWRSTNAGVSWTEIDMTSQLSLGISDVEFAPSDSKIVYMATGDDDGSLGSYATLYSVGLLKSTDGGVNFTETNLYYKLGDYKLISRILVHPSNPDIVLACSKDGIFKTVDGGKTWKSVLSGISIRDMEFKPSNPNIIYAATISFGGSNAILKSIDNGETWAQTYFISGALRTDIEVTPAAPNNVYFVSCGQNREFLTFQKSTDEANTWKELATQSSVGNLLGWDNGGDLNKGQGAYDLALAINPTNENDIYLGGINIWHSTTGGNSWELYTHWYGNYSVPEIHADQHKFKYDGSDLLYVANDGGLYRNFTGSNVWDELNNGMDITQFYRLGVSQSSAFDVISGSQDNGTSRFDSQNWSKAYTGDGMECAIDPNDDNRVYISLPYGNIRKSTNGGKSFNSLLNTSILETTYKTNEFGGWVTPYVLEPNNPKNIYVGYTNVWKNTNYGDRNSWSKISDFSIGSGLTLRSLAVAESNPKYIYAATSNTLKRTTNGGSTWETIHNSSTTITYIAINPLDPKQIYITKSGYNNFEKVLFYDGNNWEDISGNLPPVPVNTIVIENPDIHSIYIGTDIGVFYSDLNSGYWKKFEGEMPNTIVNELEIHKSSGKLYAATYGRGLWRTDLLGCQAEKLPIKIIGDLEFCEGDSVILESVNDLPKYLWNNGEKTKSIVVKESGNYVLTMPSSSYCSDKSNIVSVNVLNKSGEIIQNNEGNTLCYNKTSVRLNVPFSYTNVNWSTGETSKFITITEPGSYSVTAINTNGCFVTDTITIYKSTLINDIQINRIGNTLSVPEGYTYKWYLNDSLLQESNKNTIKINGFGKYKVEITDKLGCKLTTEAIDVLSEVKPLLSNKDVSIYPTITNNIINIKTEILNSNNMLLELYNNLGVKMLEKVLSSNSTESLELSAYSRGVYFIKITDKNTSYFQKIILK